MWLKIQKQHPQLVHAHKYLSALHRSHFYTNFPSAEMSIQTLGHSEAKAVKDDEFDDKYRPGPLKARLL